MQENDMKDARNFTSCTGVYDRPASMFGYGVLVGNWSPSQLGPKSRYESDKSYKLRLKS